MDAKPSDTHPVLLELKHCVGLYIKEFLLINNQMIWYDDMNLVTHVNDVRLRPFELLKATVGGEEKDSH